MLPTISADELAAVTGGRTTHNPQTDPALLQAIAGLSQAIQGVGQGLVQEKQQESQQSMQFLGQMMQGRAR
ncbi:MAG: hypothetical protein JO257_09415 [Deltaproteobacteria bacterium]|nr:hypothetical protein [Deltaproteobacteria bacterium]